MKGRNLSAAEEAVKKPSANSSDFTELLGREQDLHVNNKIETIMRKMVSTSSLTLFLCAVLLVFSSPVAAEWIQCARRKIQTDNAVSFSEHGVKVYFAAENLIFISKEDGRVRSCQNIGPGWQLVGFRTLDDRSRLFEIKGGGQHRYFDITHGEEVLLQATEDNSFVKVRPSQEIKGTPVPILKNWAGEDSAIIVPEFHYVDSYKDWKELWNRHMGREANVPEVDFRFNAVVAIFLGEQLNAAGATVISVEEFDQEILFNFIQALLPVPSSTISHPFGLFVIHKANKPLLLRQNLQGLTGSSFPEWKTVAEFDR